ncbi:PepSY domain-containing protein [Bacillus sp. JCM 19041]|uniref:PepSY domain-containing protein n=1 Tax=Bacillus sp. JCM 19041 TaxID=1460637 RepID=UPI000AB611E5
MFDEAEAIALEETGGGIVQQLERDQDDGVDLYEVEIEKEGQEYELDIAADSGEVIRAENERSDDDDDDERTTLPEGAISSDKAIEIALKEVKGTVTEVELDEDDGQYVYEIEVETNKDEETKIDVNALDGKILKVEIDD